jgi:hypothetical protein
MGSKLKYNAVGTICIIWVFVAIITESHVWSTKRVHVVGVQNKDTNENTVYDIRHDRIKGQQLDTSET